MGSILENMRKFDLEKASRDVQFSNAGITSDISKKFIKQYKEMEASGGADTILKAVREKNMERLTKDIDFRNGLAQSDVSKKYIEKYKAAAYSGNAGAAEGGESLLKILRKKNMDAATEKL